MYDLFSIEALGKFLNPPGTSLLVAIYSYGLLYFALIAHNTCPYVFITGTQGELVIHGMGYFVMIQDQGT